MENGKQNNMTKREKNMKIQKNADKLFHRKLTVEQNKRTLDE